MADILKCTDEYELYLRDESRSVGFADYICFAKSEKDIEEAISFCRSNNMRLTVQGGSTGVAAGAVPYGGLALNLSRMKRLLSERTEGERLFMTYEPGILLSELREDIAKRHPDRFFAPDPTETGASLGGMLACNASGACSFMYGSTREHINGLKIHFMDGRTASIRRGEQYAKGLDAVLKCDDESTISFTLPSYKMPNTKKHVAGYYVKPDMDLIDLFIGSDGSLGVVSEIEIEVLKKPAFINTLLLFFGSEKDTLEFVDDFRYKVPFIAAVEYFDRDVLKLIDDRHIENFIEIPKDADAAIYTEIQAPSEEEGYNSLEMVGEFFSKHGGRDENIMIAEKASDIEKIKEFRHAAPESNNLMIDFYRKNAPEITKMGGDMSVPDDRLFDAMDMFERTIKEGGFKSAIWAHIGNSHVHANIISRSSEEYKRAHELFKQWAREVVKMGGSVSAEHGVGKLKTDYVEIMFSPEDIEAMRRVKLAFDPANLIGVGNIFKEKKGE